MHLYLALGDSITAGYGVRSEFSFPTVYSAYLHSLNKDLCLINQGVNGLTTGDLLNLLLIRRDIQNLAAQATLITVTIGSNDLLRLVRFTNHPLNLSCIPLILENMDKNLIRVGQEIRCLNPKAAVKVANLYNPLPGALDYQSYKMIQGAVDKANAVIVRWAECFDFYVVDLERQFRGKGQLLIGPDHLHPNVMGYQVIAQAFAHRRGSLFNV